ncbi:hypothetical protein GXM_00112 [Nostoc sphaeroides CCNUC1]|uniref:Uncharacterized protein n=1 Tax=Nostoc sphaeroides CCNUC1 TaxID=2653204 RepID=A0A5P8VRU5_9NOSO|nr:hypothetical protein GXM_00112 [Nostoc sphaeroides CCNUC1]
MGDYRVLSFTYSDRNNTVRLTCLSPEDPPIYRGSPQAGDLIRTVLGVMIQQISGK